MPGDWWTAPLETRGQSMSEVQRDSLISVMILALQVLEILSEYALNTVRTL